MGTTPALAELAARLAASSEVALDTEGDSLHHYPARLALLQVAVAPATAWLVDPLALEDLGPLRPVFAGPRVVLVLHAGDNDLTHLKRRPEGFDFGTIFDTSIAARFLGARALGLDVLLREYLGIELPPSRQKDDWSARPLSEAQLHYAAADVLHLIELRHRLVDELRRVGRLAWVTEECAALAAQTVAELVEDPHAYAFLRGARELPPHGLAALRELYGLREELARAADRPPFKILSEELLVRLAAALPAERAALREIPGCTGRLVNLWGEAILEAIARAQTLPEAELPRVEGRPRARISGAASRRIEALRLWRRGAVARFALEPGLLLPNRLIGALAEANPRDVAALDAVPGLRRWRVETFGHEIVEALAGTIGR